MYKVVLSVNTIYEGELKMFLAWPTSKNLNKYQTFSFLRKRNFSGKELFSISSYVYLPKFFMQFPLYPYENILLKVLFFIIIVVLFWHCS